jgi:hypothetical protein
MKGQQMTTSHQVWLIINHEVSTQRRGIVGDTFDADRSSKAWIYLEVIVVRQSWDTIFSYPKLTN